MSNLTPDRLAELTIKALERTAFMMADPVAFDPGAFAAANRSAGVRYGGPESGIVTLHTTDDFLRGLAANLLGVEPESIDLASYGEDAIKELTNIVGGSVILELGGHECSYTLGLPQLSTSSNGPSQSSQTCCLNCEGHLLFVTWEPGSVPVSLAA